jgi:hypothetical protein
VAETTTEARISKSGKTFWMKQDKSIGDFEIRVHFSTSKGKWISKGGFTVRPLSSFRPSATTYT